MVRLAVDCMPAALRVYAANFPGALLLQADISTLFDGGLGHALSPAESDIATRVGRCNLLIGGPPCQGHSDLNNWTRRVDPKNGLYARMARAAEVLRPDFIVIENVPGVVHDRGRVLDSSLAHIEQLGYRTHLVTLDMEKMGVPQTRKRLALVGVPQGLAIDFAALAVGGGRDVRWAIGDLLGLAAPDAAKLVDRTAHSSAATSERIRYLFENGLYDLPNDQRPRCHSRRAHSYKSVYGRLRWDMPAQTITRGFYSMCMGRYVHPEERRTLSAHEAARLQFFPDFFDFEAAGTRSELAELIANAVPPKAAYAIVRLLLEAQLEREIAR